ncbi:Glucose--fructose oxidoreductase precursor [Rubripirellula amarantea]|uniref:Glucose--fructose oxidoreductase n=1 Tax=Rubripirellula amarantea TaxID=2527999 RepID=A0A5C5WQI9_9BACT|nr:Gfo/Idh/MocA family oxidoreductase [Rubripirellula amarantea]TWT52545.1 Glucose--fructose oxidoreductase precursor [Rubripirellula amarantea]
MNTRRQFLQSSAVIAAPMLVNAKAFSDDSPSNRINVAFIGTGNQGMGMLRRFLNAELGNVLAVCDVNEGSYGYKEPDHFYGATPAKQLVEANNAKRSKSGAAAQCHAYSDFREVLQRDDIDAVVIVVPDHWHRVITVMALEAGKDVYCEKPLTFSVADGRVMIDAVRKNDRILQTGSHERSNPISQFVCEAAKAGKIGKLTKIITKVGYNNKVGPGPGWMPMPVPKNLDYRTWLGPAPQQPYHEDRCLYRFRFNYDYSGGQITNFGAHCNDMAHWGMGLDTGGPTEVECLDAKFLPEGSLFNTATETRFRCKYANGVELLCESGEEQVQTRFEGTDGWLQTGYRGTTASDPNLLEGLPEKTKGVNDPHSSHLANFIDCVKSRSEPRAPVEVGHASAVLCHIANAMIRLFPQTGPGRVAKWDAASEQFVGDDLANRMLVREQRDPFA